MTELGEFLALLDNAVGRGAKLYFSREDHDDHIAVQVEGGGYVGFFTVFKFSKDKAELIGVECFE